MYGQTSSAYKHLVHAYRAVLRRMRIANLTTLVALGGAVSPLLAHEGHDDGHEDDVTAAAYGTPGPDGTYSDTHPVDPNGVFAGAATSDARIGTSRGVILYFHTPADPVMSQALDATYGSKYNMMLIAQDKYRSFLAAMSGGLMDVKFDLIDVAVTPKPDGTPWNRDDAAATFSPGYAAAGYKYHTAYYAPGLSSTLIDTPSGTGTVGGAWGGGWSNIGNGAGAGYILHELGHNLGFNHAPGLEFYSSAPGYTYDFNSGTYVAQTVVSTSSLDFSASVPSFYIGGLRQREYGAAFDVMAVNGSLSPRQKQSVGWLSQSHFANINNAVPANTSGTIRLYDDMADMQVVTRGSGADLQYGVARGYQNVNYGAYITRQGYAFHVSTDGANFTGEWKPYLQTLDFYYRAGGILYPGQESVQTNFDALVVNLNGSYLGYLAKGQTFLEKYVDANLFISNRTSTTSVLNADDGTLVNNAPTDILAYGAGHPGAPMNPDRARSVWYRVTFSDNGVDTVGHWADILVEAFSGAQVHGWQFDANAGVPGAQDGSGTWTAGAGGNWRSVSLGVDNQNWTQLEDATFGVASGTAGVVTLAGPVSVNSLIFNKAGAGNYTLSGGALSIDIGGVIATDSATIASDIALLSTQFWSVDAGKTLNVTGTIAPGTGNTLYKNGQGELALGGLNNWTSDLSVAEGLVTQNATQTFTAGADLRINEGAVYRLMSGTLDLASGSSILAMPRGAYASEPANLAVGTLRLSSGTGSASAPEIRFASSGTLATNLSLDAGLHYLAVNGGTATIDGVISGTGGIAKTGAGAVSLSAVHTFTGDLRIEQGLVGMAADAKLSGANALTFATASGQTAEFRLNGQSTTVANLASTGTHAATVSNYGSVAATFTVNQTGATTYAGRIIDGQTGALALNKTGAGTLTLSGDNSFGGGTTIAGGAVKVTGAASLGSGAIVLSGGKLVVEQAPGLTLTKFSGSGGTLVLDPVSGGKYTSDLSSIHTSSGAGVVSGTYAYTGRIYLTAGQWSFGESFDDSAYLKINNVVILNDSRYYTATTGSLNVTSSGWYDIDLRLANTGGGGPIINGEWDNVKGVGVKQGAVSSSGADYLGFDNGVLGIRLKDTMVVSNAVSLASAAEIDVSTASMDDAETRFTGAFTGTGALTKTGSGTMTLAGAANTYSGTTTIAAGTLAAGAAGAFSAGSTLVLANASGVSVDLRGYDQTIGGLAGGGANGGTVVLGSATLTTGANGTDTVFAGTISGTGGLVKTGAGTMRLSGANPYAGPTKVAGGGSLILDYAAGSLATGIVASGSPLILDNGTLRIAGRAGAAVTQNFAGLTVGEGRNTFALDRAGNGTIEVSLGAITRTGNGTIDFTGLTGAAPGARVSTTSGTAGQRLDGGASWAMVDGANWAAKDISGYIVAYDGYSQVSTNGGVIADGSSSDVRIVEAAGTGVVSLGATSVTVNSLLMSAATTATTVNTTGRTLAAGAVAVAAGSQRLTIGATPGAGALTGVANALQFVSNNASPAAGILVNAAINNNGGALVVNVSGGAAGGTTVFAGDNNYTGATNVTNRGVLRIGAGGASGRLGSGAVTIESGASLVFDRDTTASLTVSNTITGAGSVTQAGTGVTVISGDVAHTGGTTVTGGTLRVGTGTSGTLAGDVTVNAGATLAFGRSDTATVTNTVSGTGALRQNGTGTTVLTGTVSVGSVAVASGTLQYGDGTGSGSLAASTIAVTGTFAVNRSVATTLASAISGTGTLVQKGSGMLTLTGNNTYGATRIDSGTLVIGAGGTTGSLGSGTVTNNGNLMFNRSDSITVANVITGSGTVSNGAGTLILTGDNTYTGVTNAYFADIVVGAGGTSGTLGTGDVFLSGRSSVSFNRSDVLIVANRFVSDLTGGGDIRQIGSGTTVLTGDSNNLGDTIVDSGTLRIGDGGTTGSIQGDITVASGATLEYRRGDTYTPVNTVTGAGTLAFAGSGTAVLTGNAALTGTVNVRAGATLRLGDGTTSANFASATIVNDGVIVVNGGSSNTNFTKGISGTGTLTVEKGAAVFNSASITYTGDTTVSGGSLQITNDISGVSRLVVKTGANVTWNSGTAAASSANAITLDGGSLITTNYDSYLALTGDIAVTSAGGVFSTRRSRDILLNGVVSGSGAITVLNEMSGSGGNRGSSLTIFANGANTYSGTVTVNESTFWSNSTRSVLGLGHADALKYATVNLAPTDDARISRNQVEFSAGVTAMNVAGLTGTVAGGMTLTNATGNLAVALTVNNAANNTFAGVLSGKGSLTKNGAGTLTLSGANTYTGTTTVGGGTLALDFSSGQTANAIVAATSALNLAGGRLLVTGPGTSAGTIQTFAGLNVTGGVNTLELARTGGASFDVNVGAITLASGTVNFVGLTGTAAGARVVTSSNVGVNDGYTLLDASKAFWEGTDFASIQSSGGANYIVKWRGSYADVYTGDAGGKQVVIQNAPTATARILENGASAATNSLGSATTTINALLMNATGTASVVDFNEGTLVVGAGDSVVSNIAVAANAKSLTLGLAGETATLTAGSSGASTLNLVNLNATSTLTVNASIRDNSGAGAVSVAASGPGEIVLSRDNTYAGGTSVGAGATLRIGAGGATGSLGSGAVSNAGAVVFNRSGALTLAAAMSGAGSLRIGGGLNLTMTGTKTYTGATVIDAGSTLSLGDGVTNGALAAASTVTVEGTLVYNNAGSLTSGNAISGSGTLRKLGGGELTIDHNNTHSGGTILQAGAIRLKNAGGGLGSGTVTFAGNSTLATQSGSSALVVANAMVVNAGVTASFDSGYAAMTFTGDISGAGNLSKGNGNLTLTGNNTYSGTTSVGGGSGDSLIVGNGGTTGTLGAGAVSVGSGRILAFNRSNAYAVTNAISGGGSLVQNGSGTITLATASAHTGGTTVNAGTLLLNAANNFGAGATTVNAGATLGGKGGYTASGATTVASGGVLRGGDGTTGTTLTISGSAVTFASGSVIELALGASAAHSTLAAGSGASLVFDSQQKFNFLNTGATLGTFDNLITGAGTGVNTSGWSIVNAGWVGTFTNDASGNIDFTLTAVPEPSAYGLIGASALAATAAVRRRRSKSA